MNRNILNEIVERNRTALEQKKQDVPFEEVAALAETDEEWNALRDETIQRLIDLGEPEVFKAYQQKWDAAAAVIVPLVHQAQIENGIEPYTKEQYGNHP